MANLSIRRQNGDRPATFEAPSISSPWEPWRMMRSMLSWDPFRELATIPTIDERAMTFAPAFEVKETKDAYLFKADVPGIEEKDFEVTMTGNRLTVGGKRESEKEDKSDRYYTYERNYGSFSRSFTLPEGTDIDKLRASLEQGVLTITVPKRPEVQPKKIAVKSETAGTHKS